MLAAVISPIVDYNTNAAGVALASTSVQLNDQVIVFSTSTLEHGSELWRTDGTAEGTFRLTDLNAGPQNSEPKILTHFGDAVYFSLRPSTNGSQAVELWKTNGTVAGTLRVSEFSGEPSRSNIDHMLPADGTHLNFILDGEIWQTDGTEAGTLKQTSFRSAGSHVGDLIFVSDAMGVNTTYLAVYRQSSDDTSLWRYNLATDTGTVLHSHRSMNLQAGYAGRLLYTATDPDFGSELWYSDGTPETTALWMDINPGPEGSEPTGFYVDGTQALFSATTPDSGRELWRLNDYVTAPQLIDLAPGPANSNPSPVTFAGGVYVATFKGIFRIEDDIAILVDDSPYGNPTYERLLQGLGDKLYYFDDYFGVSGGQQSLSTADGQNISVVRSGFRAIWTFLGHTADGVLFLADDRLTGLEIWTSDGTFNGTHLVRDIATGTADSNPNGFTNFGGQLAFFAQKDVIGGIPKYLAQTTANNSVRDIAVGTGIVPVNDDSFNGETTGIQWQTRIQNTAGQISNAIVTWDGSQFRLLAKLPAFHQIVHPIAKVNGILVAAVYDASPSSQENAIWSIGAGGELDERLSVVSQFDQNIWSTVGGKQYFVDVDYRTGRTILWQTDGTAAGTGPVQNVPVLDGFSAPQFGAAFVLATTSDRRGLIYLTSATDDVSMSENLFDSYTVGLQTLRSSDDGILFARNFDEIWFTSGTPESTRLIARLPGAAIQSNAVTIGQNTWFFIFDRNESPGHWALMRTDGTLLGTTRLVDFPVSKSIVQHDNLSVVDGKLLFGLEDSVTGASEIWVSDGTATGTTAIAEDLILSPSVTPAFVGYGQGIAFAAATPEIGFEPFRIDTTIQVTPPGVVSATSNGSHLTWLDVRGAIQYDVWIASLNNPAMPVHKQRLSSPEYALPTDLPDGAYRVWTRSYPVIGTPSAWNTPTDFVKGSNPAIHSVPAFSVQNKPLFKWTGPTEVVSYEFWLTNRDTKTRVLYLTGQQTTSRQIDLPLDPAKYAVWVRGTRENGTRTDWSDLTEFEILAPPVQLTSGKGDSKNPRPTFAWAAVTDATGYDVRVFAAGTTTLIYGANNVNGLTHTPLQDLPAGKFTVYVRALKGSRSFSAWGNGDALWLKLPPINLRSTATGVAWDAVPFGVSYTFELRDSRGALAVPRKSQTGTTFDPATPLTPGQYSLRVFTNFSNLSSNWSATYAFELFRPPVAITSSGAATVDATPTITWTAAPGAATYEVVVTKSGGAVPVYARSGINAASHRIDIPLGNGVHEIQVRAIFADGSRSLWSPVQQLFIGPAATLTYAAGKLSWSSVNAATNYELWINYLGTPSQNKIVYQPLYVGTSYTLPSTLPKGRYQTWLRAIRAETGQLYAGAWTSVLFDVESVKGVRPL